MNPVEGNFLTRFVLGLAVISAMIVGGSIVARGLSGLDVPYASGVGMLLGAFAVFAGFSVWYTRYDASWAEQSQ